ncbi:Rho GTPase activation protein, partial [Caulochytrium protostelioides]
MTKQTFRLVTMFGDVSQEREQAAGSLLRLYESQGLCIDFIASLTQVEIERCTEPNTLFRGNSIATKTLDGYMKMKAGDYLKTVLGDTVRQILSKKPNCEIDPTRLDSKDARKKNLKTLMDWNNRIVQGIFSAAPQFPPALRVIFHRMQICIIRRFPNETNTHIVAVAGFVFLRFFAAAILGPRLFGLTEEYIDPKTARVFTLLAKTLQSLANLNLFGSKEPYMEDMNPFIQQNMQGMRDYIHTLTKRVEVPATTRERSMLTYTPEVDLSNLVEMFSRCKSEILQQLKPGEGPMGREFATIIKDLTVEIETARVMAGMYESASNESAYDHRSRLTLQTRRPQTTDVVPSPADAAQTSLPDSPQPLSARSNATLPASSAIRETPTCY